MDRERGILRDGGVPLIDQIRTDREGFRPSAIDLWNDGYRLMDMLAEEPVDGTGTVSAIFRNGDRVVRLWYPTDGRGVTISRDIPCASPFERKAAEMSGIVFDMDMPPIIYRRRGNGHPLQKEPYDRSTEERIPLAPNDTVGDDVFEIPVGPVHAGIIEPGHFRFSVAGEPVIELKPSLGYTHRGIEKMMEIPADRDMSRLVERISGDTCVANCIAYAEIMESDTRIPRRAKVIRALMAEMERLYNHIGAVAGICTDTAFNVPSAMGSGIQEKVLRMNMSLTHHRQLMNCVVPGGVRRDIPDSRLRELDDFLIRLKFELMDLTDRMTDSPALQDRLEGTGVLTNAKAVEIGTVGPIARASGVRSDVRRELPYECYDDLGLNLCSDTRGDVNARTKVRMEEIFESINLVHQCTEMLEPGETRVRAVPSDGFHCSVVEAPCGELVHSAVVRDGRIWRYSVRDPSFVNWFGMCHAVPGNVVPDFPLINKSFGLSYAGNDL